MLRGITVATTFIVGGTWNQLVGNPNVPNLLQMAVHVFALLWVVTFVVLIVASALCRDEDTGMKKFYREERLEKIKAEMLELATIADERAKGEPPTKAFASRREAATFRKSAALVRTLLEESGNVIAGY